MKIKDRSKIKVVAQSSMFIFILYLEGFFRCAVLSYDFVCHNLITKVGLFKEHHGTHIVPP